MRHEYTLRVEYPRWNDSKAHVIEKGGRRAEQRVAIREGKRDFEDAHAREENLRGGTRVVEEDLR